MNRRQFLGRSGAAAATGALLGAPAVHAAPRLAWKMVTTWAPQFPVFQTGAERFAELVRQMSDGRLSIKVFAGGELVPPLGVFDAVSGGMVEMGHAASYYWAGKVPEAQFFTSCPFGMNTQQTNAWLTHGGGLDLWRKVYAPHNLVPFAIGNSGCQMEGWFKKKLSGLASLKGIKMRVPGLGAQVMAAAGVNVVLLPGSELYTALERGTIDAVDWVGPYHDMKLGFHRAAKYYYYPGWREPSGVIELTINRKAWESLPKDLQAIVATAAAEANVLCLSEFEAKNGDALKELTGKYAVQVIRHDDATLKALARLTDQTLDGLGAKNKAFAEVRDAYRGFMKKIAPWTAVGESAYTHAKGLV
ncbi:MAG: TRAP transporter substrate-binding protein DctP [Nitrospinae bacterium]|nr:TRAP transporter substrate-binding protein DctP [Nitrospinota bacterium]